MLGADHPKVAETVNNLGSIAYQSGDFRGATAQWQRALPMYRAIFGPEHQEVANVLNNLGRVALVERRLEDAERDLGAALAMDRRFKGAMHDDLILPLNSLGLARKAARLRYLRRRWANRLQQLPRVRVLNTDDPAQSCGLGAVTIEGVDAEQLTRHLEENYRNHVRPRHVEGEFSCIRVAPNVFTTVKEVDTFSEAIEDVVRGGL